MRLPSPPPPEICSRDEKNKESKANALGVENIGGVFVVLLCGLAFAILVAILEFCWNSKKNAQNDRQSLCAEMAEELRFAVRCHGSRQRPALKRNCVKCSPGGAHTYVPSSFGLPPHHYGVSDASLIRNIPTAVLLSLSLHSIHSFITQFSSFFTARNPISKRFPPHDGAEEVRG